MRFGDLNWPRPQKRVADQRTKQSRPQTQLRRLAGALTLLVLISLAPGGAWAKGLCVQPLQLPFEEGDERFDLVSEKIGLVFESAGFEIISSDEFSKVYEAVDAEWGDVLDPYTGWVLPDKMERYKNELASALAEDLGCAARLRVSLQVVRASFFTPMASWDGTQQQVISTGRALVTVLGGGSESGWVSATSIWIELMDLKGMPIAFRSAGVEILSELSLGRDVDKLPIDRWLRDEERLDKAIRSALGTRAGDLRYNGTSEGPVSRAAFEWPSP